MSEIVVRHSTAEDSFAIHQVLSGSNAVAGTLQLPHMSESVIKQRLVAPAPGIYSLVAEIEGQVVATLTLNVMQKPRRQHAGNIGMAVLDSHTGQGIGSALLEAALELGENWLSLSRIELTVFTDNDGAIALYKKYKFKIEGEAERFAFRNGEYVNAFYMARVVTEKRAEK